MKLQDRNKTFLAIAGAYLALAILAPIAVYGYLNSVIESYKEQAELYKTQLANWSRENEALKERIREHMEPFDPYLMEPYLTTDLGWFLHDSSDPVPESRNKLTIYGQILNIGAETAYNCKLTINFYENNTIVQTSEIKLGTIEYWGYDYTRENIGCNSADSITGVSVERFWTEKP